MFFIKIIKIIFRPFTKFVKGITRANDKLCLEVEEIQSNVSNEHLNQTLEYYDTQDYDLDSDKIIVERRSMLEKLNSMEQLIKTFDETFPDVYNAFLNRIQHLKDEYLSTLEEYLDSVRNGILTFEINPDDDSKKVQEVLKLERDINFFVENDFKFYIFSKRIQKMCLKLNLLYNVSIKHSSSSTNAKVLVKVQKAKEKLLDFIDEVKESNFSITEKNAKEYLIGFIFYADYLLFKCTLRSSCEIEVKDLLECLFTKTKFQGVDYAITFKDFVIEELENLSKLLEFAKDSDYYLVFMSKIQKLQNFNYDDFQKSIESREFWNDIFEIENEIINCVLHLGCDEQKAKVALLKRFNAGIDEKEIFISVKSESILAISSFLFKTQDTRFEIILKILNKLNDKITYKEMYFILLLFDLVDEINLQTKMPNSFTKNINKQVEKYGGFYSKSKLESKKKAVLNSNDKTYVKIFFVKPEEVAKFNLALCKENLDFVVLKGDFYLNSFYFQGFENINDSLNEIYKF